VPAFCTKAATRAGIAPAPCGQCCWLWFEVWLGLVYLL